MPLAEEAQRPNHGTIRDSPGPCPFRTFLSHPASLAISRTQQTMENHLWKDRKERRNERINLQKRRPQWEGNYGATCHIAGRLLREVWRLSVKGVGRAGRAVLTADL